MKKMLRTILLVLISAFAFSISSWAQQIPSDLTGASLRQWLKSNYYDNAHIQLGYSAARLYMYNYIDNHNNTITCVYSGYTKSWAYGGTGTNPYPINCEHTVPQSFFDSEEPMRSDLHHLFPTYSNWNSIRSNYPFADIDDNETTRWMYLDTSISYVPSYNIDYYSEYADGTFEPREDHKGDVARAIFYFYTMYPTEAGNIERVADIGTLYQWHLSDPVDAEERERNDAIEYYQGDRNPYIDHPEIVDEAWLDSGSSYTSSENNELFFSEYIEGSSYNKALEIANFTGNEVSLSQYSIKKQVNGSGSWESELILNGNLAHGNVYTIVYSSATSSLTAKADLLTSSAALSFNGNDPVGLFKNGVLIDIIGTFNGGTSNFAKDVTLTRKNAINRPSTSFTLTDWTSYSQDTFNYFGFHTTE